MRRTILLALVLALPALGCTRNEAPREQLPAGAKGPPPFDWDRPAAALGWSPDEVAARLGSFDWTGVASWSVSRGDRKIDVSERHAVRQLASGDFAAEGTVDPGRGPGSEGGKRVLWTKGMSYARSLYPAGGAWRERPDDHGRDARRFRDESFLLAGELSALLGPALTASPAGTGAALGRPARRFALSLDRGRFTPGPSRLSSEPPPGGPDADTKVRLALLDGREPIDASGELLLDAATGVPLSFRLSTLFGVKGDPDARVRVDVEGRVTGLGGEVAAVDPPARVLPDERKPRGVARALEQAGLRKKKGAETPATPGAAPADGAEPEDVGEGDAEE
jgi:hypothetical protein